MVMKIVSWNVAGLRARMKNNQLMRMVFASPNEGYYQYFDIVCLQDSILNTKNNIRNEIEYFKKDLRISFWVIRGLLAITFTLVGILFFTK